MVLFGNDSAAKRFEEVAPGARRGLAARLVEDLGVQRREVYAGCALDPLGVRPNQRRATTQNARSHREQP